MLFGSALSKIFCMKDVNICAFLCQCQVVIYMAVTYIWQMYSCIFYSVYFCLLHLIAIQLYYIQSNWINVVPTFAVNI